MLPLPTPTCPVDAPHGDVWACPAGELSLANAEVHVWRASLDLPAERIEALQQLLSADERERAERFAFIEDRYHFIAARGILRTLLGRYLGTHPQQVCFCYNAHGKPALVPRAVGNALSFNVSHSHGLALYAITCAGRRLGIDLERLRSNVEWAQIAERFFASLERALLSSIPPADKLRGFFCGWTRKEAYLKARGEGLSWPMDRFSVSLLPGEPARLIAVEDDPEEVRRWSMGDLVVGPDYAAALAYEGSGCMVRCWQWAASDI